MKVQLLLGDWGFRCTEEYNTAN